ncbi:hypothetical protein [Mycoplasma sp. E35C]|uniref:hypothetical protein n=1 Tax=Mycoplasma sp. E35C TaxID=2801918 RepID=UPI00210545FA|nr:hypothetical protein [Mycoplasma sp. E35C]
MKKGMQTGYSHIDKQEKANNLFGKTPIAKAIWIVCLPGLLASFFAGLYSFLDQILIQTLVPNVRTLNDVYNGVYSHINVYQHVLDQIFVNSDHVVLPNIYFINGEYWQASMNHPVPDGYFNADFLTVFGETIKTSPTITLDRSFIQQYMNDYQILDNIVLLYKNVYNAQNNINSNEISQLSNVSVIARQAVNSFQSITIIGNAVIYLIPLGAGVYYTKSISYKYEKTGRDIWVMSFWATLILCIFATLICYALVGGGLQRQLIGTANLNQTALSTLNNNDVANIIKNIRNIDNNSLNNVSFTNYGQVIIGYDNSIADLSAEWGDQYSWLYVSGFFIVGLFSLLSYLIRSEGRNIYVTVAAIASNLLNVFLDWIFMQYGNWGLIGGAGASVIGWAVNLLLYIGFVMYCNHKNTTWINFKDLFKVKFNIKIIIPIMTLGLSSFIRSVGVALMFLVYNILLIRISGQDFQNYHASSMPLLILFFISLFGIADGGRPLVGYNYTNRNYKRVHQAFWWSLLVTFTYSVLSYVIVLLIAKPVLVSWFNFKDPDVVTNVQPIEDANAAWLYTAISMLRTITFAITICGLMLFQGTNNIIRSYIASGIEGVIIAYVVFFGLFGIAQALPKQDNTYIWVYVSGYAISPFLTSVVVFITSLIYLRRNLNPKNQTNERKMNKLDLMQYNFFLNEARKYNLPTPEEQHKLADQNLNLAATNNSVNEESSQA